MRLHLEDANVAIADVDHARVLARPMDDMGALSRQLAQVEARGLVRAMLVPHRRDDAEFGEGWDAADQRDETRIFVRLEAMGDGELFVDLGFGFAQVLGFFHSGGDSRPLALSKSLLQRGRKELSYHL